MNMISGRQLKHQLRLERSLDMQVQLGLRHAVDKILHATSIPDRILPLTASAGHGQFLDILLALGHWQVNCYINRRMGGNTTMMTETATSSQPRTKMFLDIPTAAEMAGFSIRHFRRIIEEDGIPIVQIGRKFFILGRDFATWESNKKSKQRT